MLEVYLNYPNSQVTVHGNMACRSIRQMSKARQRRVRINPRTLQRELRRFGGEHEFGSTAARNDMWVTVDLGDARAEEQAVERMVAALRARYAPFGNADVVRHC